MLPTWSLPCPCLPALLVSALTAGAWAQRGVPGPAGLTAGSPVWSLGNGCEAAALGAAWHEGLLKRGGVSLPC